MILTITLNPALDKMIRLNDFKLGKLNKIISTNVSAGGKGINVTKILSKLNIKNQAVAIIGGNNGELIKSMLIKRGINSEFIYSKYETRQNLKIIENNTGRETEINAKGKIEKNDLINFINFFKIAASKSKIIILSGSLPLGIEKNIYAKLIQIAFKNKSKIILDSSGKEFKLALKESPYLVKPNLVELEALLGKKISSNLDLKKGVKYILNYGVKLVMVSLGAQGAFIASKTEAYRIYTPHVKKNKITVGAGDTMVAGLAAKLDQTKNLKNLGNFAAALATSFVETGTINKINKDLINSVRTRIKSEKIY